MTGSSDENSVLEDNESSYIEVTESEFDEPNDNPCVQIQDTVTSTSGIELEQGPHPKLTTREDILELQTELKIVKDTTFICSLDLLLKLFIGCVVSHQGVISYHRLITT